MANIMPKIMLGFDTIYQSLPANPEMGDSRGRLK